MSLPPPLEGEPRKRLLQTFDRIGQFAARVEGAWGDQMECRAGCDECCRQVLALRGVEAAYLLEGARQAGARGMSHIWRRLETPAETCPLLLQGFCLAHSHRPAICRTHGLPLLRREGERAVVHHCSRNFRGLDPAELSASLILDEARLVLILDVVDELFCRETGWPGGRVRTDELLRAGLRP
ncbi:MAG: hypothetical protein Kow0092_21780 [Deferrisomatales bacterium]